MSITLQYETTDPQVNEILRGVLGVYEMMFPERIRGYYLIGSYLETTAVGLSDIDLYAIFKGDFVGDEQEQCRQLRHYCSQISPLRVDLVPRSEHQLQQTGVTNLKLASALLYGEDVRDTIPLEPLDVYLPQVLSACSYEWRVFYGSPPNLSHPFQHPDPAGEFLGYERYGFESPAGYQQGVRTLVNWVMMAANGLLVMQAGQRSRSKGHAVAQYRTHIGDEWSNFLAAVYKWCKLEWGYAVPTTAVARQQLRDLCQQNLAFANHFWTVVRPYLTQRAREGNEIARRILTEITYTEAL